MKALVLCVLISSLLVLAAACSTKTEPAPEGLQVAAPMEAPPPMPTDHRLQLGIDGDPGYTQKELTPEELVEARAAGERHPEPSYVDEASEPSYAEQPGEPSQVYETDETTYVGDLREPLYRDRASERARVHHRREGSHDNDRPHEPSHVEHPPREAVHVNPPHGGPHR